MNIPTLTRPDMSLAKQCLDKLDRARGNLMYVRALGRDVTEPLATIASARNGIVGVLQLSQKTEEDLKMLDTDELGVMPQ
jgi:hypothetical protein